MSGLLSVLRLLARPVTLWNVAVIAVLAGILGRVAFVARGGQDASAELAPEVLAHSRDLVVMLGSVLVPGAVGACLGWSVFELLLCPFAPLLPRVARRLVTGLTLAGLLTAAGTAWWCEQRPGPQVPLLFCAQAFLWFALAFFWSDPSFVRLGAARWILQAIAWLPIFAAPEIVAAFEEAPWILGPLAPLAGIVLLCIPFRRSALRVRVLDPECAQALSYRSDDIRRDSAQYGSERAAARVAWRPLRRLAGSRDWAQAALYEGFGWVRGGWLGAVAGNALFWSGALAAIALFVGFGKNRSWSEALAYLHGVLHGPSPGGPDHPLALAPSLLPVWVAMFFIANPLGLFAGPFYPLSRERRAEATWRAELALILALVLSFAVVLGVAGEIAHRAGHLPARDRGLPEFLRALVPAAVLAPLPQWARLRFVEGRTRRTGAVLAATLMGVTGVALIAPTLACSVAWRDELDELPVAVQIALFALLFAAAQALWREVLRRHFRTRDLAA